MSLVKPPEDLYYSIFGRYIDPIVPIIIIFGLIGLYNVLNKNSEKKKIILLLITSILPLIILFAIDFPSTYYRPPNMFTLLYIQKVSTFLPVIQFIIIFAILLLGFFTIIMYYKKFWPIFIIFLMIISITGFYSTLQFQSTTSSNTEKIMQIGQYLITNSNESSRILMTKEDYNFRGGYQIWFGTQFYIKGYLIRKDTCSTLSNNSILSNDNCQQNRDLDYIISHKNLPYPLITTSDMGFKLYKFKRPENQTI